MTDTGRVAGSMLSMGAGAVSAFGGLFDSVERKESLNFKISNKYTRNKTLPLFLGAVPINVNELRGANAGEAGVDDVPN